MTPARRTPRRPRTLLPADLARVLEPLASYICATDRPKAVLNQAFAALFTEVARVTDEARAHVAERAAVEKRLRRVDFDAGCSTPV